MQDRYTADIGDFGKYGLLRYVLRYCDELAQEARLGVLWYLTEPEDNNDGRFLGYLDDVEEYRRCDPELYAFLKSIRDKEKDRSVESIEQSGLFPNSVRFFSKKLSYEGTHARSPQGRLWRTVLRDRWLKRAMEQLGESNVVFLDPDNGLPGSSTKAHSQDAPKFAFPQDIGTLIDAGKSVIVYQHDIRRKGGNQAVINSLVRAFVEQYDSIESPRALRWNRHSGRTYIVLPVGDTGKAVRQAVDAFMKDANWRRHFESIALEGVD
jgi:hypothetical protein